MCLTGSYFGHHHRQYSGDEFATLCRLHRPISHSFYRCSIILVSQAQHSAGLMSPMGKVESSLGHHGFDQDLLPTRLLLDGEGRVESFPGVTIIFKWHH